MKKALSTVGIVAAGAMSIQTAQAQEKPWNISATVRGFYDDNINTTPGTVTLPKQSSYGFELKPEASYIYNTGQLEAEISYAYSMKYYENRSNSADHRHQFGGDVTYQLNPRARISFSEEFVIGQESEVLDPSGVFTTRTAGNNVRNSASISALYEMTRRLATEVSYSNYMIDYEPDGPVSRSALLDRMEHRLGVDLRWEALETTIAVLGYNFSVRDQTSDDPLSVAPLVTPDARDSRAHYVYLGADHEFSPNLRASARVGVQYTEYPNLRGQVGAVDDDTLSPYADANVTYSFSENGSVQVGVSHDRVQSDLFALAAGAPTLDAQRTRLYGAISYAITPRLKANVNGELHNSNYQLGAADSTNDLAFISAVNLEYEICQNFAALAGYAYDRLDSDTANRSFTRNRVFLGFKASF